MLQLCYTPSSVDRMKKCKIVLAKLDSAASKHYWKTDDLSVLHDVTPHVGPSVTLPDDTKLFPDKKALFHCPESLVQRLALPPIYQILKLLL